MRLSFGRWATSSGLLAIGLLAAPAAAEEAKPFSLSVNAGVVSDYRFRGQSYSDRDPAVQGGLDISHESGVFVGTWLSSLSDYSGAHTEIDLYTGYATSIAGFDLKGTVYAYVYPHGQATNYYEFQGTIGRTIGPVTTTLLVAYYPDEKNVTENLYLGVKADVPIPSTPLTASVSFGRENGSYDEKLDWQLGLSYTRDWFTVSASYVDTNYGGIDRGGKAARAGFVGSLVATF